MNDFLSMNWDKITTIFFAGMSAIFAGLSFFILCLEYKRNNPNIVVKMNYSFVDFNGSLIDCISCAVINRGRRPVKIKGFNFLCKNKKSLFFLPTDHSAFIGGYPKFPQTLGEGESYDFIMRFAALIDVVAEQQANIEFLSFSDSADNTYRYKIKKKHWQKLFK
jgi:hypothetical protein